MGGVFQSPQPLVRVERRLDQHRERRPSGAAPDTERVVPLVGGVGYEHAVAVDHRNSLGRAFAMRVDLQPHLRSETVGEIHREGLEKTVVNWFDLHQ